MKITAAVLHDRLVANASWFARATTSPTTPSTPTAADESSQSLTGSRGEGRGWGFARA